MARTQAAVLPPALLDNTSRLRGICPGDVHRHHPRRRQVSRPILIFKKQCHGELQPEQFNRG
jgi:hypothetical protein